MRDLRADLELCPDVTLTDSEQSDWEEAIRRAMAAEQRVQELEAAIHAECRQCGVPEAVGHPETCPYDDCPLWPYGAGAMREEAERDAGTKS